MRIIPDSRPAMKALVLNALGRGFDFEDVDIAAPMGREVLVNVQASGLCHTDLLFATHDIAPTPSVLGHELAGIVATVGPDVTRKSAITSWGLWGRGSDWVALPHRPSSMRTSSRSYRRRCPSLRRRCSAAGS